MIIDALIEFYLTPLKIFFGEKDPVNYFVYAGFEIQNYRGVKDVSINFSKNDLLLLLGLNESGKTSILRAIETFDFNNDPSEPAAIKPFLTSIRNKQDIESSTPCIVTAEIVFSEDIRSDFFNKMLRDATFDSDVRGEVRAFIERMNAHRSVRISRVVPFSNGNPGKTYYKFEGEKPFSSQRLETALAQEVVRRCPYIIYFEDFQDAIPQRIYTSRSSDAFNSVWYEILDGLFYNTDKGFSIRSYLKYFAPSNRREDDARTVLKKVNKVLQETFTEKWVKLSGVREIQEAELIFQEKGRYFEIKITETDGTTYSVHERSKGAVWYLAFLMKTEFRRKKLREDSGKPIYLIDEPASNLHPTAQQKMVEDFYSFVEDTTLIYTTHSRYLVSESNVRNTFVVQRNAGIVRCTKWGEFIQGRDAKVSYYQPLFDCLDIVPSNFDFPWQKAIITEGPSDAMVLKLMHIVLDKDFSHAVYPGSSATNVDTLISLNLGWNVGFKVLLDSDKEGNTQRERYKKEFDLPDEFFVSLPVKHPKIEEMFTDVERSNLYKLAFGMGSIGGVSKKEFLNAVRVLLTNAKSKKSEIVGQLSKETKSRFLDLLGILKSE